jgi:hypothetical protein
MDCHTSCIKFVAQLAYMSVCCYLVELLAFTPNIVPRDIISQDIAFGYLV